MNDLINKLNSEIDKMRDACLSKTITEELSDELTNNIIKIAIDIYKDEEIKFYIPYLENNNQAMYYEEDRSYVPIYSDINHISDNSIKEFKEISLKQLCRNLYENIATYTNLESMDKNLDPEYLITHIHEINEMIEYANNNPKIDGIMYEPFTNRIYGFEAWQVQAIMFKGMGVNSFIRIDAETGDIKYEL